MEVLIQILTGALGTLGFSLFFSSKKQHLFWLTLGGGLAWAVYLLVSQIFASEVVCYYMASLIIGIYSEVFARILKTPTTSLLIPGILPLVPGGSLYYTMRYAFLEEWEMFFDKGLSTLGNALAIAMGIITVSALLKITEHKNKQN